MTVRAVVIDDSFVMRSLVSHTLQQDPEIEVVGTACDVTSARQIIKSLDPDVITLDVEMPGMDGINFLERLMRLRPMPVVMLSTLTSRGADATLAALELGAFDCVDKAILSDTGSTSLADTVKAAASSRRLASSVQKPAQVGDTFRPRSDALIAIGASTGGVEALIELLRGFPENCPPTMIVQHMPATFTASFAARLDRLSKPKVEEARAGSPLTTGKVYLAPGGENHLEIAGVPGRFHCRLVQGDRVSGHRPSVDRLFSSVARHAGAAATGAILTGMGADGAVGLKAMRDAGSATVGQDQATSVVYGMPAEAHRMGAVTMQLSLNRIAAQLMKECSA
ncbi:protein-glutamate methylesterase/protein-glutamine glutaminase [Novosphingopyxis iocasae]|uniref:protein-glutamate methylesterase/protein-glutamine glutaminase n=1 Tax=Novosphingopyxis iocasae TaxID=2762729 RepID=UPI0016510215|nr:chemotaxis response regulator protein-glutamate methylesterase [Novosphingopyxis iocasae]